MKSSFCIDLQRFMLIPTKFPLSHKILVILKFNKNNIAFRCFTLFLINLLLYLIN